MCAFFVAVTPVGLGMGYFILSKYFSDNLLFQIRIQFHTSSAAAGFLIIFPGQCIF